MNETGGPSGQVRGPQGGDSRGGMAGTATPRIRAEELLRGTKELIIEHGTVEYRLRLTSNGKLILTK